MKAANLDPLIGMTMNGGCDRCDAHQTLERMEAPDPGRMYLLTVHHDPTCPVLRKKGNPRRSAALRKLVVTPPTDGDA